MGKYTISKFEVCDLKELTSLIERCLRTSCGEIYNNEQLEYWISLYSEKNFQKYTSGWKYWVAKHNSSLVGCIGLNGNEIKGMFVEPCYQGKQVGRSMLSYVESYAKEKGISKLVLDSSVNAIDFYKKYGYSIVKKKNYETDKFPGSLEVVKMHKKL